VPQKGVQCLDARSAVRFAIASDGELLQNVGMSTGSRQVELYDGRAIIRARIK
jgi:beta-galactosidase